MLRIGLTGGIGSGKSVVARIFEVLGIPVYYADKAARRLMQEDPQLKQAIIENFGAESFIEDKLNRSFISSIVFNDPGKLQLLNSLVHPATMRDSEAWTKNQSTPYAIHEAALIFEASVNKRLDYVIGVSAPREIRIKRVMERDGISSEDVEKRMKRQMDEEAKLKLCDFIIMNDDDQMIIPQVLSMHEQILKLAAGKN